MTAVTNYGDFGAQENKVGHCFPCFPLYLPWSDGAGCHDLCLWVLSFKPACSLPSFTPIKKLFNSSLLCAVSVISPAYLRLLIFLPEVLILACESTSPAFHRMYSAYKLNKQGDNIQPWHTLFPIRNQSTGPCPVLTAATWPAYTFLRRQVRWSHIPTS